MKLSRHAKNRLRKFELSLPSIQECIDAPDFIEDEIKGGKNAWKKFDDRFIKVTFATKASEHIIITVTLKEKPPKEFTQ